jgi:hypothetical protein
MKCALLLLVIIVAQGCAVLTEEQEEIIQYNRQIDLQNWTLCKQAYERSGTFTIHFGHTHQGPMSRNAEANAVKDDLIDNHCKMILRDYWADHI